MKLSILDQAPVSVGHTPSEALQFAEKLALLGDELGFERMWMAEHHNTPAYVSSAPEITAAHLAAKTKRIRIGTGGVMMMHYSPLKLAEVFKTLSAFAPGRIDYGVGRAPGGDHHSIRALAEGSPNTFDDLYDKFATSLQLLNDQKTTDPLYKPVQAYPQHVVLPQAWLLGSSGQSAIQAGRLGVGYSFAQFFNGAMSKEIFDAYRTNFQPSDFMEKPFITVTYAATVAKTKDEAEFHALPIDLSRLFLTRGHIRPTMTPEEAKDFPLSEMDKSIIDKNRELHLVGTAAEVARKLEQDIQEFQFDEIMINSNQHSFEARLDTYRLLAKELI